LTDGSPIRESKGKQGILCRLPFFRKKRRFCVFGGIKAVVWGVFAVQIRLFGDIE
jgi:hypothetical protein